MDISAVHYWIKWMVGVFNYLFWFIYDHSHFLLMLEIITFKPKAQLR